MIVRARSPIRVHVPIHVPIRVRLPIRRGMGASGSSVCTTCTSAPGGFPCALPASQIASLKASGATDDAINQLCASYCQQPPVGNMAPRSDLPMCAELPGAGTVSNPMIAGLIPGQPGYQNALQAAVLTAQQEEAANPAQDYGSAQLQSQLTTYKATAAAAASKKAKAAAGSKMTTTAATTTVAQSNAPNATTVPRSTGGAAQSNAPGATAVPAPAASSANWFDGIPNWIVLAGAGGLGLLLFMGMGGRK